MTTSKKLTPVTPEGGARKKSTTVSVAVSPSLLRELKRAAKGEGLTVSGYFRALHAAHVQGRSLDS